MMPDEICFDSFPPRLRCYFSDLQAMLADASVSKDGATLISAVQTLENAPRVIKAIIAGQYATWIVDHAEDLGGQENDAVRWASRVGSLIVALITQEPIPPTGEVFSDPAFDSLVADGQHVIEHFPQLLAAARFATLPTASECCSSDALA